jgi:peptidoglycan-associated lipoprotein
MKKVKLKLFFAVLAIGAMFILGTKVYAAGNGTNWSTPCGFGNYNGESYLSSPCGSSFNCCLEAAPATKTVKIKKVVTTKVVKKVAPVKPLIVEKRHVSSYNISARKNNIHFAFNKYAFTRRDISILNRDASYLKHNPGVVVQIQGNCDRRGSEGYNLALGWRRANAAKVYLEKLGINSYRLKTISYGKERPICNAHTRVCYAINRRDHFAVVSR